MIRVGSFAPFQHLVDELYKTVLLVELVTGGSDDERLLLLAKSRCFGAVGQQRILDLDEPCTG